MRTRRPTRSRAHPERAESGDDDDDGELVAAPADEAVSDADFYSDAFGTIS